MAMKEGAATTCPTCGRPLDEHDRHVRLILPDPVLRVPAEERAARTWGADPLLQVDGIGAFVRVLLPIALSGGYSLTYGTWLAINPAELTSVWERWSTDAYRDLRLDGFLANAIPPWGEKVLGSPATASILDPNQFPYIVGSQSTSLDRVLSDVWPHEEILSAVESVL
jgi:hypothetical protein